MIALREESLLKAHQQFYDALFLEMFKAIDQLEISEEKTVTKMQTHTQLISA